MTSPSSTSWSRSSSTNASARMSNSLRAFVFYMWEFFYICPLRVWVVKCSVIRWNSRKCEPDRFSKWWKCGFSCPVCYTILNIWLCTLQSQIYRVAIVQMGAGGHFFGAACEQACRAQQGRPEGPPSHDRLSGTKTYKNTCYKSCKDRIFYCNLGILLYLANVSSLKADSYWIFEE